MKTLLSNWIVAAALCSSSAFAADLIMQHNTPTTLTVQGCGRSEVASVKITPSISGEHQLTSRCLPIWCVYTNERPSVWLGTTWTIQLSARDTDLDSKGVFKGDPQFDRRFDQVIHKGVSSKEDRDALIKRYLQDGTCKDVYFKRYVPAV